MHRSLMSLTPSMSGSKCCSQACQSGLHQGRPSRHHCIVRFARKPLGLNGPTTTDNLHEQRYEDDSSFEDAAAQQMELLPPTVPWKIEHVLDQQDRSQSFRRTVYSFERWTKHRSAGRYAENMCSIPTSRILTSLGAPLLTLTLFSASFCAYQSTLAAGTLPAWMPSLAMPSPKPQVLTSFALSLLLVFRTNSSYGRFDDARKMWGGVLNRCRDLVQQAVTCLPADDSVGKAAIGRWSVAYARALAAHVQEDVDLARDLRSVMMPHELELLLGSQNRPIKCLSVLSELLAQSELTPWQRQQFQLEVAFFHDTLGGCERLLKTPIPVSYTRHTCRFLIVWLTALPLGLWDECGWSTVPISAIIAALLLGIEEIGVQIEEPFGILPLESICERVELDVQDILRESGTVHDFVQELHGLCVRDQSGVCAAFAGAHSVKGGGESSSAGTTAAAQSMPAMQLMTGIKIVPASFGAGRQ